MEDDDDESDDEEDDQLIDSDLSEPNYRFSQHDLIDQEQDDGAEDGEEDYGSEEEFEGSQRGRHRVPAARRAHHHDHQDDSFSSS